MAYNRLFGYDVEALEGGSRFGDLAFTELKPLVERIRQLAWDLTVESWQDLPDTLIDDQLLANVNAVNETLEQIGAFDLSQPEPANAKNNCGGECSFDGGPRLGPSGFRYRGDGLHRRRCGSRDSDGSCTAKDYRLWGSAVAERSFVQHRGGIRDAGAVGRTAASRRDRQLRFRL